jgi:hypothetical protein
VVFYGARSDCVYRLPGNRLPLSILNDAIIQPYTAFLEREKARREARLARYGHREEPAAGQVDRYVQAVYDNLLTELAQTEAGLGPPAALWGGADGGRPGECPLADGRGP